MKDEQLRIAARKRINYLILEYCNGSQQEFSNRTKISKGSVSLYANGKNVPTNKNAQKIATSFQVEPAWVMGFDVPMRMEPEQVATSKEQSSDVSINDEQFREYMRAHYGMLFDLMDGATPEERKQVEGIAKLIVGDNENK